MSLRLRLALTVLVVTIPLGFGLRFVLQKSARLSLEESGYEFALGTMQAGGRAVCEAFPESFPELPELPVGFPFPGGDIPFPPGIPEREKKLLRALGPKPPKLSGQVGLWAYDHEFGSQNPKAPTVSAAMREALNAGDRTTSEVFDRDGEEFLRVIARMPWEEGPAAIVLVERELRPREQDTATLTWGLSALVLAVLLGVLLAMGPVVARTRRLKRAVLASASTHYAEEVPVEGRDEIAELARAFNRAAGEVRQHVSDLESRETALRNFVADTTHDVMTPLTVLKGHLVEARDDAKKGRASSSSLMRSCIEEAHYMASLVQNLGTAARLECSPPELALDRLDLSRLTERVFARHRPFATSREINLVHALPYPPIVVSGDVTLVEQAVSNVVHNAIRYNDAGGHVSIALDRVGGEFALAVIDDGPGVEPELITRLTDRDFRTRGARSRSDEGLGLGLAIAKDVVVRHDWRISLSLIDEGGLSVVFSGPMSPGDVTANLSQT